MMEAVFHVPAKTKETPSLIQARLMLRGVADANCPSHKSPCDSCEKKKRGCESPLSASRLFLGLLREDH